MGKYTTDHQVTVKDGQGRVVNQYTAQGQIDPVKTGGAALGPVIVFVGLAFVLLSVLPVFLYGLYMWHFARTTRSASALRQAPLTDADSRMLGAFGFTSIDKLYRSSVVKLVIWIVLGGLIMLISETMIFTGKVKDVFDLLGLSGFENVNKDNVIERVFTVYQQAWWVILGAPMLLAALFAPNELCTNQLIRRQPNKWLAAATLPYKLVSFVVMKPLTAIYRLLFGSVRRAAVTLALLAVVTAGYQFQLSSAVQDTDQELSIITGTFSAFGNDRTLILREVESELEHQNKEINGYYGAVEPISTLLASLIKVSGSAELSRYWLWSGYAPQSVLTQLVRGYNASRYPVKTFKFRLALWQTLGGDLNQADVAGLRPWAYTSSLEGYELLGHLGIELTDREKAVVYLNIKNDVIDFSGRQRRILEELKPQ